MNNEFTSVTEYVKGRVVNKLYKESVSTYIASNTIRELCKSIEYETHIELLDGTIFVDYSKTTYECLEKDSIVKVQKIYYFENHNLKSIDYNVILKFQENLDE